MSQFVIYTYHGIITEVTSDISHCCVIYNHCCPCMHAWLILKITSHIQMFEYVHIHVNISHDYIIKTNFSHRCFLPSIPNPIVVLGT